MGPAAEHCEGDERLSGVEAVGASCDESDAGVDRLDEGVGEAVVERCDESIDVADDAVGDGDEGLQPAIECPLEPLFEERSKGVASPRCCKSETT